MRVSLLALWFFGCGGVEMSASWQLDRVRILAVSAMVDQEPDPVLGTRAEARPGETVKFEALYYVPPEKSISGAFWIGCIPESDLAYGCEIDENAFDALDTLNDNSTLEDFQAALETAREAGFIGFEPDLAPEWTVPEDALDGLSEAEQDEGTNAFVNISLLGDDADNTEEPEEIGFKRFPVSVAETPNHNPEIVDFIVADTPLEGAIGFNAQKGLTYVIEPVIPAGHIETYRYTTESGSVEYRSEEPYITWFTELGATNESEKQARFDQEYSLYPYTSVEWTAPEKTGPIQLHVVIRDRRGGMSWASLKVNVL